MSDFWRLWAKSLGAKASSCDKESDTVAIIRTIIFLSYFITNGFIITNVIRHWNSNGVPLVQLSIICESVQNTRYNRIEPIQVLSNESNLPKKHLQ
jgi:hypothetical protein